MYLVRLVQDYGVMGIGIGLIAGVLLQDSLPTMGVASLGGIVLLWGYFGVRSGEMFGVDSGG